MYVEEMRTINCNEWIVNNKSFGELWFEDHYVSLKYMIFY